KSWPFPFPPLFLQLSLPCPRRHIPLLFSETRLIHFVIYRPGIRFFFQVRYPQSRVHPAAD
ncbi:uncharacterized protein TRIVIDRAFT_76327, partial [Trichoderma virens Gv29-8]